MHVNPSQRAYAQGQGTIPTNGSILDIRNPGPNDVNYALGQFWINQSNLILWYLNSLSNAATSTNPSGVIQATWLPVSIATSAITSISGNNGVTVSPSTGAVVVSGIDATTTSLGVASFNPANFTVTAGAVSLAAGVGAVTSVNPSGSVTATPTTGAVTVGLTGITQFDTLIGGASNTIANVSPGTSGQVLTSNGAGAAPTYQTAAAGITGTTTPFAVIVGNGTNSVTSVGPSGTIGQVLQSGGPSANPAYSTAIYPSTTTANQLLYSNSTNNITGLATANGGVVDTSPTGVPQVDTTNFQVLSTGVQVKGNNTGTAPPAGFIGEQIRSYQIGGSPANNTAVTLTSIVITPGVWDVTALCFYSFTGNSTAAMLGISTTNNSFAPVLNGDNGAQENFNLTTGGTASLAVPSFRVVLSTSTTYYCVILALFSTGACTAMGRISATRVG